MRCPTCGHENRPGTLECVICHAKLSKPSVLAVDAPAPAVSQIAVSLYGTLQPRDLGGLIGETFVVYRRNFAPMFTIAMVGAIPSIIAPFLPSPGPAICYLIGIILETVLFAGITWAVVQHYLRRPVDVGQCFSIVTANVGALLVAAIVFWLVLGISALLALVVVGIFLLFYFSTTMFLFTEAIVIERKSPIDALSRSIQLVKGNWWRSFRTNIVLGLVVVAATFALQLPAGIVGLAHDDLGAALSAFAAAIVFPLIAVGRTLEYFDLRVRKEGFTLDILASEIGHRNI